MSCCLHLQGASFTSTQPARVAACLERVAAATPSLMDKSAPLGTTSWPAAEAHPYTCGTLVASSHRFWSRNFHWLFKSCTRVQILVWPRSVGRPCRGASLCVTCGCPAAAAGRWSSSPQTRPPSLCPTRCTPTSCSPPPTWCPTTAALRTLRATAAASGTTSAWVRPPPFPLLRAQRGQPWMQAPLPWSCHAAAQSGRLLYAHTSKQTPPALSAVPPGSVCGAPRVCSLRPRCSPPPARVPGPLRLLAACSRRGPSHVGCVSAVVQAWTPTLLMPSTTCAIGSPG